MSCAHWKTWDVEEEIAIKTLKIGIMYYFLLDRKFLHSPFSAGREETNHCTVILDDFCCLLQPRSSFDCYQNFKQSKGLGDTYGPIFLNFFPATYKNRLNSLLSRRQ